jgi:hypothetical protein
MESVRADIVAAIVPHMVDANVMWIMDMKKNFRRFLYGCMPNAEIILKSEIDIIETEQSKSKLPVIRRELALLYSRLI